MTFSEVSATDNTSSVEDYYYSGHFMQDIYVFLGNSVNNIDSLILSKPLYMINESASVELNF